MISIHGIDHVALNVRNLDRSLTFYTETLGLKISKRENQKAGKEFFLDAGPSVIGLIQGKEGEGEHLMQNGGIGGNHFSFRVKAQDFDAAVSALKKAQVTIHFFKKRERSWSVYFEDPDGNKLEMTAWPQEDLTIVQRG